MKKLSLTFLALLVSPILSFAVPQDSVVDQDKVRNDTRNPVNWKTTRTGEYDVPWGIVTNSDGSPIGSGTGATATTVASTALEASHVLKSSAGSLVSLIVANTNASAQWILVMNSTTVPSDGAVTLLVPPIRVAGVSTTMINFEVPLAASTGISVSNSSTGTFTKTVGAADCAFTGQVQ